MNRAAKQSKGEFFAAMVYPIKIIISLKSPQGLGSSAKEKTGKIHHLVSLSVCKDGQSDTSARLLEGGGKIGEVVADLPEWWQNGIGGCNQKHFQLLGSSASSSSGCYVANERLQ